MTPIMKCHIFSGSDGIGFTKICALYKKIFNLQNLWVSLIKKTLKNIGLNQRYLHFINSILDNFFKWVLFLKEFIHMSIFFKIFTESFII
jgi:hypothetical protein